MRARDADRHNRRREIYHTSGFCLLPVRLSSFHATITCVRAVLLVLSRKCKSNTSGTALRSRRNNRQEIRFSSFALVVCRPLDGFSA